MLFLEAQNDYKTEAAIKYPAGVPYCHIFYYRLMCQYINKAGVEMSQSESLMIKGQNSRCEPLCGAFKVFINANTKDVLKLQLLNKVHFIMCTNYTNYHYQLQYTQTVLNCEATLKQSKRKWEPFLPPLNTDVNQSALKR